MTPDVLVVGGGPTGLSAALFLGERGRSVRVVERDDGLSRRSKAFGVNPRSLALLESSGVTERLLERGRRLRFVNFRRGGKRLLRIDVGAADTRFPFMLILPQAKSEAAIAEVLAERGIAPELGVEATSLRDVDAPVVSLRQRGGAAEEARGRIVLGADGPDSMVRGAIGADFEGSTYEEPWRLYDLALEPPLEEDEGHAFLHDEGAMFVVRLERNLWRVVGNVPGLLDHLPSGTRAGEIEWESEFTIRHRIASRLSSGAVCLAGDAAHVHSPLGARGMNLGIEDAHVFARLVELGREREYERIRRPVVASVVRGVARLTAIPRGRSLLARLARRFSPVIGLAGPFVVPRVLPWVLGLDHPADVP